jgi:PAS domain S-box-containing protein
MVRALLLNGFPRGERALGLVALALAYFLLAKLGLALASLHPSASPVWPPSGLALAAMLLWGIRIWPAIAIGAFFANATTFGSPASSLAIAAGNTLEAVLTAWLLERWSGGSAAFDTPTGVAKFASLALAPGTMIAATIGVGSLVLGGHADTSKAADIWMTWWLGDLGGQLLVTPVVVLWGTSRFPIDRVGVQRLGGLLFATVVIGIVAFSPLFAQTTMRGALAFFAIAPMLWAALRHGQRDTATAALVLSLFALWGTFANGGPFARPSLNDSFLLALMFVISTAVPSLALSADVAVRRRNEERYRALVDNANDIVATFDLEGRFTSVNPAVERILGYAPQELLGMPLGRFVPQDEMPMHESMLQRKLAGDTSTHYEMGILAKDGHKRLTLDVNSRLICNDEGRPLGIHSIARDITERKEAEARQMLLVRELQHRTKNMLAVIQSIVTKTLRRSPDLTSAEAALIGRLHALAHAQEFVAAGPAGGVPLRQLVEAELAPFAARAIVTGEPVVVGGAFAQTFALLIHELATNAVKHGALSAPRGRVVIEWKIDRSEHEAQLQLAWMERGGPAAKLPKDTGLGTILMSSIGKSRVEFKEEGFEYALKVPLQEALRGRE